MLTKITKNGVISKKYTSELGIKPGKELIISDSLSRANIKQVYKEKMDLEG